MNQQRQSKRISLISVLDRPNEQGQEHEGLDGHATTSIRFVCLIPAALHVLKKSKKRE